MIDKNMKLKVGDYYSLYEYGNKKYKTVVKITDTYINDIHALSKYVFVLFIKVPDRFCSWKSYSKYGISIPILKSEFVNAKKLTYEEVVALEL